MVINHNLLAMNAERQYNIVNKRKAKHAEKLSSGYRINRAADDAAGLAISEKMRGQIRGLNQGIRNTQDGISLLQVADGALNEVHDMMQRLNELCVQAANGTNTLEEKKEIQKEILQVLTEIDNVSGTTTFNGQKLFDGTEIDVVPTMPTSPTTPITPTTPTRPVIGSTQTTCGDFTVQGGTLGTDFDFAGGVLTIKTSTPILVRNTNPGTATTNRIEVVKDVNANIILKDVKIDVSGHATAAFKIADDSKGNVNITLDGTNTLKSGIYCAGLQKNGEGNGMGKLTISGVGNLDVSGGSGGAGIGGSSNKAGSNITISDGMVTATGNWGAGIWGGAGIGGGGNGGVGSNITISGGTVIATGHGGAGIGGGAYGVGNNITISGGTVTTSGNGGGGAGIGGGSNSGVSSKIIISGGNVTTTGGNGKSSNIPSAAGAGIGGGYLGVGSDITISGGSGTVTCDVGAQKIGSGKIGTDGTNNTVDGQPAPTGATDRNSGTYTWNLPDKPITPPTDPTPPAGPIPPTDPTAPTGAKSGFPYRKWWIQSGANEGNGMFIEIGAMNTSLLGIRSMDVTTDQGAADGISAVHGAISCVSGIRGKIGAQQNRLEHTIVNEGNIMENTTAAESRIRDADIAEEMSELSTANILAQAGEAMLAQANTGSQGVLALLEA